MPETVFDRINARILALQEDPRPPGVRKLGGGLEGWRIRAGDYCFLYQIDDGTQTVVIVRVKHRREV